ncbi:hypothetical protein Btru_024081 [Bulinus truncatus]|nr:hypothetical protein Btru_024081 [Bulinus truncatus]
MPNSRESRSKPLDSKTVYSSKRPTRSRKPTNYAEYITYDKRKSNIDGDHSNSSNSSASSFMTSTPVAKRKKKNSSVHDLNESSTSVLSSVGGNDSVLVTEKSEPETDTNLSGSQHASFESSVEHSSISHFSSTKEAGRFKRISRKLNPKDNVDPHDGLFISNNDCDKTDISIGDKCIDVSLSTKSGNMNTLVNDNKNISQKHQNILNKSVLDSPVSHKTPEIQVVAPEERRRRGRPPKFKTSNHSTDIDADLDKALEQNVSASDTKRRSGRHPKLKACIESSDKCNNSDNISEQRILPTDEKRKRGRIPAKKINDSCEKSFKSDESSEQKNTLKKKRGQRPKSSETGYEKQNETDKNAVSTVSSLTCLRCNSEMDSLPQLKRHMMTQHSLMWCAKEPMGVDQPNDVIKKLGYIICQKCAAQRRMEYVGPKQFKFAQYYKHHLIWCGREEETATCEICNHTVKAMWLQQHLSDHKRKEKHKEKLKLKENETKLKAEESEIDEDGEVQIKSKRKAAKNAVKRISSFCDPNEMADQSGSDFTEDQEDEDNDEEIEEDPELGDEQKVLPHKRAVFRDFAGMTKTEKIWCEILIPPARMTQERRLTLLHEYYDLKLCSGSLFPDFRPVSENWMNLSKEDSLPYTPQQTHSVKFGNSCQGENILEWGHSKIINGKVYCYTGGPIWSLEWCPIPESSRSDQFLALTADMTQSLTDMRTLYSGPGCIQIWSFGEIQNKDDSRPHPALRYCIAHDEGYVVSMSWCPGQCYDSETRSVGCRLLPVGNVLIYGLPHPDSLKCESTDCSVPIYHSRPVLTLVPNSKNACGPCLTTSWQQCGEHRCIIGGYGNGSVYVWDLLSRSPLLQADLMTMRPIQCFKASMESIMSCSWNPRLSTSFITTSYDGSVRLWDLNSREIPVVVINSFSIFRSTCWAGPMMSGFFITAEYFRGLEETPVSFYGITRNALKNFASDFVMHTHPSCIWDVSFCPIYEALVSCDSMGNVRLSLPPMVKLFTYSLKRCVSWHKLDNPVADIYQVKRGRTAEQMSDGSEKAGCQDGNVIFEGKEANEKLSGDSVSAKQGVSSHNGGLSLENRSTTGGALTQLDKVLHVSETAQEVGPSQEAILQGKTTFSSMESKGKLKDEKDVADILYFQDCAMEKSAMKLQNSKKKESGFFAVNNITSVHRVSFNPNVSSCLWLASGGQAGLLRLDNLSALVVPQKISVKMFYDKRSHDKS